MFEPMKLLGNTKSKIITDKNGKKMPHLKIREVILVHCNIAKNDNQHDSKVLHTFLPLCFFWSIFDQNFQTARD